MSDTQDAAPSSTEPVMTEAANDPNVPARAEASMTEAATGELPNVTALGASSIGAVESATTESPMSTNTENTPINTGDITATASGADDPNAVASPAVSLAESALGSSATPASPLGDTPVVSASVVEPKVFPDDYYVHLHPSVVNTMRGYVANIKAHLIGFEQASVAKIHAELEAIERIL